MITLSPTQAKLVASAQQLADILATQALPLMSDEARTALKAPGLLVSGHRYRTACSLERMGRGTVRYQGPSLGWFSLTSKEI